MTAPSPIAALGATSKAEAAERARGSAGPAPAAGAASLFAAALDGKAAAATAAGAPSNDPVTYVSRGSRTGELKPEQQFEGFMLRTFVESMLPSENSSFYGEGMAGGIWKSMLAERIGDEMAKAGGIGIADMLTTRANAKAAEAAGRKALETKASDAGALAFRGL